MAIDFAKKGADIKLVSRSEEKLKEALEKVSVSLPYMFLDFDGSRHVDTLNKSSVIIARISRMRRRR